MRLLLVPLAAPPDPATEVGPVTAVRVSELADLLRMGACRLGLTSRSTLLRWVRRALLPATETGEARRSERLLQLVGHLKAMRDLAGTSHGAEVGPAPLRAIDLGIGASGRQRWCLMGGPPTADLGLAGAVVERSVLRVARVLPADAAMVRSRLIELGARVVPLECWLDQVAPRADAAWLKRLTGEAQARPEAPPALPADAQVFRVDASSRGPRAQFVRLADGQQAASGWALVDWQQGGRRVAFWGKLAGRTLTHCLRLKTSDAVRTQCALRREAGAAARLTMAPEPDALAVTCSTRLPWPERRLLEGMSQHYRWTTPERVSDNSTPLRLAAGDRDLIERVLGERLGLRCEGSSQ